MFIRSYDPNIRTHLIRAVPELAQERVAGKPRRASSKNTKVA